MGKLWAFKCILRSKDIKAEFKKGFMDLLCKSDQEGRNPLHVAAASGVNGVIEPIVSTTSDQNNVLHIASKCKEESGRLMVERWPHLISEHNQNEKTPLEIASEDGTSWLVESILQKDRSSILRTPKAWVEACRKGHLQTILTFVDKSTYLRYVCRESHDTPLHHVEFQDYTSYQELLQRPVIQELKNNQDCDGDTPLHKAIEKRNKDLTEILFTMEDIYWNIKNNDQNTALDLLEQDRLCKVIGVDPQLKIT
ncbi:hypothetical protein Cgig2_028930 [Carnegiea gigantea]|uniref:Uncharacterized protein n=1 Tax=Carnegiea gigantea TaxID=171969 RepID=A0A9Q1KQZ8_9CARY|nr:hypothetical protein Cgig2_028930 [Carnegiea gigantea]